MKKAVLALIPALSLVGSQMKTPVTLEKGKTKSLKTGNNLSKCERHCSRDISSNENDYSLLIFMSFSVPIQSWKALSRELESHEGAFILRGSPDDSMRTLFLKLNDLREKGITAPILIDPESFEKYKITAVPSIVLSDDDDFDRVTGNIPVTDALRIFSRGKSCK